MDTRDTRSGSMLRFLGEDWPQPCPTCAGGTTKWYDGDERDVPCSECGGGGVAWGPVKDTITTAILEAAKGDAPDLLGGGCSCENCAKAAAFYAKAVLAAIGDPHEA